MQYQNLSDVELLGIVIGARETKRLYGGRLRPLFFPGEDAGEGQRRLFAAHELVTRMLFEELKRESLLSGPNAVKHYLRALFAGKEYESFVVLFLDSQHRVIASEEVSRGTIDAASVYPREVVKTTLRHNAAAVILAHNHPSGVAEPSAADRMLTDRLKQALAAVDVRVLDHFVVGADAPVSFAERGWV